MQGALHETGPGEKPGKNQETSANSRAGPRCSKECQGDGVAGSGDLARSGSRSIHCRPKYGSTGPTEEPGMEGVLTDQGVQ